MAGTLASCCTKNGKGTIDYTANTGPCCKKNGVMAKDGVSTFPRAELLW